MPLLPSVIFHVNVTDTIDMKQHILITVALISSHLFVLFVGASLQVQSQSSNSHAHLSDVGDAITLGEYFCRDDADLDAEFQPARASKGIIYRILVSSTPGPNSEKRLRGLNEELETKYPHENVPVIGNVNGVD